MQRDFDRNATEEAIRTQLRLPPHSLEAESSLLGSLLLDASGLDAVEEIVTPSSFYRPEHQIIFETMVRLARDHRSVDVITVHEELSKQGRLEAVGGLLYLNDLAQFVATAANVRRYAEIVRERALLRKVMQAGDAMAQAALAPGLRPITELIDEAEQSIMRIGEEALGLTKGTPNIYELVSRVLDRVQSLSESKKSVTGIPSGLIDLDRMTAGLHPGDLVILAARPAMGKTSLALNIAEHVSLNERKPVAVFSMEMGAEQLVNRLLSSTARIDQSRMRTGDLQDDDWTRLIEAMERMRDIPIEIDETPGMSVAQLRASARRMAKRHGELGLIVVDYLQLMSGSATDGRRRSEENRNAELGEISRGLKMLAKELNCTVIALSQLNRGVESRADKRPLMSDLRESGALEQDADLIWFIYRDEYYNKEKTNDPGTAELIVAKHRNGPTGTVRLAFIDKLTRFENLAAC